MKKTDQLATKNKKNAVQANKNNTPKKVLITPKKVQPTGKGKSVGGKKLPPKKGKNSTKNDEEEPEDDSKLELNNMQEDSVESNGIDNGATNGSDAPNDSSSDDDGISGNARQLVGKILPKIQSTNDDDDDQECEGEDSEEENEVNPIKNQSKEEDGEEDDDEEQEQEQDKDDDEEQEQEQDKDDEEEEEGNEQNNEDEDEEDDVPDEENIKNEDPKEGIDVWKMKKGLTAKDKDQSADSLAKLQSTVYVKRLKNRTTEEDIKKHFKSIGEITAVKFEKRSKLPSAVVTFADVASSKAAVIMNNTILNDCTILVRHAQAPKESSKDKECTILVVNVDKIEKLEGERLEKIFSKVGEIEELSVVCEPNVLAFVTFKTKEAATEALKLDGTVQDDLKIHVKPYKTLAPKTRIFISNISANATEADLRKMFEPCGQIKHITLKRNQFGATCNLKFDTEESFCKSFSLHDEMLLGKPLNVQPFSKITSQRKPFQKNAPNSGPFQGNTASSRGSFRGNWQNSRASFRGNWQSSRGSFWGNKPNSDQFNGKRQFPGPFDAQGQKKLK